MIGHALGIIRPSAQEIKNSVITINEITYKHNYHVLVVWIAGHKVLIEDLVDGCLEKKPVLRWVDSGGHRGIVHVCDPLSIITGDPEVFVREMENMPGFKTRLLVISDRVFIIRKPRNHAFPVPLTDPIPGPFLSGCLHIWYQLMQPRIITHSYIARQN